MPFIVSTSEEKPNDPETRKLIRSHVMLGKNRGKTRRYKHEILSTHRSGISIREKFELLSKSSCAPNYFDRAASWQSLIPFADSIGSEMLQDIVDFTSIAKKLLFPLKLCINFETHDKAWFQPLFFDALYLHTLAFSTNAYFRLLGRSSHGPGREPELHFVKTLGLLRERLVLDDDRTISEVTIVVVLSLSIHALLANDLSSARTHLQGLHRLICLRGGLGSISRAKLLVEMFRCDINLALASNLKPLFFRDPFWEPLFPYPDQALVFSKSISTSYLIPTISTTQEDVDDELAGAWSLLKKFCLRVSFAAETGNKLSVRILLDTMASVMYRLLDMRFEVGSFNEANRLGMLAFSSNVFLHPYSPRISSHQLPTAYRICASGLQVRDPLSARFSLWFLMVGALSGIMAADESLFASCLRANLKTSGNQSFSELQHDLESFLWIGYLHDKIAKDIFATMFPSLEARNSWGDRAGD
ncbi:hypothetical protein H2200_002168 [Cladophialophora chaetospira]|uniref:Transcription factor domain-containing protein n=1 Tax=Cladophialophora chaetospira TaxID=386627 RepID=A0AA39CMU1_9EURO|nr:hypothetical protein H2200_002168 [Cladophialophora chaetospira]